MSGGIVNIQPGVSVLSVLRYLNYKPWFALAEFVDNSLQSALSNLEALRALHGKDWALKVNIRTDLAGGRIVIEDNAAGIDLATFPRAFRPAMIPPDRSGLSEFGMGMKSAACWFAPRWSVRTRALGEEVQRSVHFDIKRIVRDELNELAIDTADAVGGHFTEITLEEPYTMPLGKTVAKIKEHLTDIYRVFIVDGVLRLEFDGEDLRYESPPILRACYYKDSNGPAREWRKEIEFDLGGGMRAHGFAALMDPGSYARSGFALFRRRRLIQGSADEGYRPPLIFGRSGRNSFAALRLFGELHLDGFEVSHTKDGFRWDENEQPFLELLRDHLDSDDLPLLRQCANYRSLAATKDRTVAATKALNSTAQALQSSIAEVLTHVWDQPLVDASTAPLESQPLLATKELRFEFRGTSWLVRIELSDDPAEKEWLSISDPGQVGGALDRMDIRVAMAHPFMVSFAQENAEDIDPLLRVAAALALAERLARRAGIKSAGTIRRNMNEILREALSHL